MSVIVTVITGIHVIISIFLIITVLLQPGKGDDLGSVFGGTTQSIFGASGAVPFLTKITRILAILFIITSLSLGYFSARGIRSSVVEDSNTAPTNEELVVPPKEQTPTPSPKPESSPSPEAGQKSTPSKGERISQPKPQPPKGTDR